MPVTKKGFNPTLKQARLGAPSIRISDKYSDPFAPKTKLVDISFYEWTGINYKISTIKGMTPSVAQAITKAVAKNISTARSEKRMQQYTEEAKQMYFNRQYGRSAVFMENLATETGLARIFQSGLKGNLSPEAQANFDKLVKGIDYISDDRALIDKFYKQAREELIAITSKYYRFKQNNRKIDPDDTPDAFTTADVKEMEKELQKLVDKLDNFITLDLFTEESSTLGRRFEKRNTKW